MPSRAPQGRGSSGKGSGCLIWIAIFLFIGLLFVLNLGKIEKTLKNTNFLDILKTRLATQSPGRGSPPPTLAPSQRPIASIAPAGSAEASSKPSPRASAAATPKPSPGASANASASATASAKPSPAASTSASASVKPGVSAAPKFRNASLFFVRIDDDGTVIRQETKRSIPSSDSPLTDALNALLGGPTADDLNKGYLSLIPQGTRLLSVTMRGSTAEVNFNEAFMFNSLGIEGYAGQLKQVVWTATAFPTVQDVQIIIEGRKMDYLGGEGVFIGLPLSRNSF
jgi:germination protein M